MKDNTALDPAAPVAVIGMGCRFPGDADSPESFWELLVSGKHTVGEVPEDRWKFYESLGANYAAALRKAIRQGTFLRDIGGFDAEFFGISPREAELMDPQQRIMLEVSWEALEDAGIPAHELAGTNTGVFAGVCTHDYGGRLLEDLPGIEAWTGIGAATCAIANRVSHVLDLRGPSLAVDTACSASLVALHLACQSLRLGESDVALAGGVNLLVSPGQTLTLGAASALAPDGRCKCFDATADGYGRGEGCGVLVLKLLADAQRDGDRVLGIILGSAVSQDGHTPGIMAPCGQAQEHVMTQACRRAGIAPGSVGYVEAHGTGTRLGDPLEAEALSAVYGSGRDRGSPCLIGSVKSIIGHLEGAAGVAGVIKALLVLGHGEIPPTLLSTELNPAIPWATSGLRVATERTPWRAGPRPRRAGVSGFGYGGTVAHVILEEAPPWPARPNPRQAGQEGQLRLYPVSAGSQAGLQQYAGTIADWLSGEGSAVPAESLAHTLALRRSHLNWRGVAAAAGPRELADRLRRIAAGEAGAGVATGSPLPDQGPGLVWVFSGHGAQWAGMGRDLLRSEPSFAAVIDALEPVFTAEIGFSPRRTLEDEDLVTVDRVQTMIFALQVGLAEVWRSYGVTPAAVIGHSVGEIAAAVVSGALSLTDGARLSCRRSKLLRRVAGKGAMAMVALPFTDVAARLGDRGDVVAAISSSPLSTVVSGDIPAVEEVIEQWRADNIDIRKVATDVAFHSPHMDELLGELAAAADTLSCGAARIPMYVTALPDPRRAPVLDGSYWAANLRNPVRLAEAVSAAAEDGYRAFLEVSAHPVVTHSIGETLADKGVDDAFAQPSLRRNQPERETLLLSAATLHCRGVDIDWERLQPGGELVTVPHVSWQRRRHWRNPSAHHGAQGQHAPDSHVLLGARMSVAGSPLRVWRTMLDDSSRPYPGSHTMNGVEIVPAAVLIGTLLGAGADGGEPPVLTEFSMLRPLMTAEPRQVQVVRDGAALRLASRTQAAGDQDPDRDPSWLMHTTARLASRGASAPLPRALPGPSGRGLSGVSPDLVLERLAAAGVPTTGFEWTITELLRGEGSLRARVRAEQCVRAPDSWAPALDAALSVGPAAFPGAPVLRVAAFIDEVAVTGAPPADLVVDAAVDPAREDTVNVLIARADGRVIGRLAGLHCPVLDRDPAAMPGPRQLVHELEWRPADAATLAPRDGCDHNVVLIAPDAAAGRAFADRLAAVGVTCHPLSAPDELTNLGPDVTAAIDVLVMPPRCRTESLVTEAAIEASWLVTRTAQVLGGLSLAEFPRLWCLTTGVKESMREPDLAHAPLWGLGRVLHGEHPELWGGLVDLDPSDPAGSTEALARLLRARPAEDVIALRHGAALVPRLVRPAREPSCPPLVCRPDGTYLVTGGLGILGLEVARWLAERGARRIVLASRRTFPAREYWGRAADAGTISQIAAIRAIEALGVTVKIVSLDITDAQQAADLLAPGHLGFPPVRGVVHAAGVLDNRMAADVDEASLRTVMRPKTEGAWVLHRLFPPGTVDFFVLFSSCGQLLGLPGQASYGAANAFLDALALYRGAYGRNDTTSFGWTSWRGKGMAVNDVVDSELRARGVADITASDAFEAWDFASRLGAGHYAVLRIIGLESATERPAVLSEVSADDETAGAPVPQEADFTGLPPAELRERVRDEVTAQIAKEMKLAACDLDPRRPLVEQGLDSVMTLVIRRRLEKRFGHSLPATLLWHQPTITAIAGHLTGIISDARRDEARVADPVSQPGR